MLANVPGLIARINSTLIRHMVLSSFLRALSFNFLLFSPLPLYEEGVMLTTKVIARWTGKSRGRRCFLTTLLVSNHDVGDRVGEPITAY
jgi:hypothetical protein